MSCGAGVNHVTVEAVSDTPTSRLEDGISLTGYGERWNRFPVPGTNHAASAFGKRYVPTLTIANTSSKK
ncbi:MAG: hypothetical protein K6G31_05120 [Paludibacteraceae bacterium]|nr:hypothetical protein [Paludibacteraceae bacterium]